MADGNTLTTIAVALISAGAGAAAAIYGPLVMQRRQAGSAHALQERQADISKEMQLLQSQLESATERAKRTEARIQRIVAFRTIGRDWQNYLVQTLESLQSGSSVRLDDFDCEINRLSKEVHAATSAMLLDKIWIASTRTSVGSSGRPSFHSRLEEATSSLRAVVSQNGQNAGVPEAVREAVNMAIWERKQLQTQLLDMLATETGVQITEI